MRRTQLITHGRGPVVLTPAGRAMRSRHFIVLQLHARAAVGPTAERTRTADREGNGVAVHRFLRTGYTSLPHAIH